MTKACAPHRPGQARRSKSGTAHLPCNTFASPSVSFETSRCCRNLQGTAGNREFGDAKQESSCANFTLLASSRLHVRNPHFSRRSANHAVELLSHRATSGGLRRERASMSLASLMRNSSEHLMQGVGGTGARGHTAPNAPSGYSFASEKPNLDSKPLSMKKYTPNLEPYQTPNRAIPKP